MTWFKVDDKLYSHPKWLGLSKGARSLWVTAGSWCSDQLSDGFVPKTALLMFCGTPAEAKQLVDAELWHEEAGGWQFHDWDEYQLTRDQVDGRRKKEAAKKASMRAGKAAKRDRESQLETLMSLDMSPRDSLGDMGGESPGESDECPLYPYPYPNLTKELTFFSESEERADVAELCALLADLIEGNGSKRPTITKGWKDSARLLLDKDGRSLDEAKALLDWCQRDEFWRGNILSMPKFREKYDQLRLQRDRKQTRNGGAPTAGLTDDQWVDAFKRAEARDQANQRSA